jgi:hypothetical protein
MEVLLHMAEAGDVLAPTKSGNGRNQNRQSNPGHKFFLAAARQAQPDNTKQYMFLFRSNEELVFPRCAQ